MEDWWGHGANPVVQVSAGVDHAVLLRTDGSAYACGLNQHGQCSIPSPEPGTFYVEDRTFHWRDRVLQLDFVSDENEVILTCLDLAGQEVLRLKAQGSDLALDAKKRIAEKLHISLQSLQLVLPDGELLATVCKATPLVTVAELCKSLGWVAAIPMSVRTNTELYQLVLHIWVTSSQNMSKWTTKCPNVFSCRNFWVLGRCSDSFTTEKKYAEATQFSEAGRLPGSFSIVFVGRKITCICIEQGGFSIVK